MKLAYHTITWGGVVGHPAGVTSVKDLYYLANGSTEEALRDISGQATRASSSSTATSRSTPAARTSFAASRKNSA